MNLNSENPKVGRDFQEFVQKCLEQAFGRSFLQEYPFYIGMPARPHRFDCVSVDQTIVVECKCYTWTVSGNIPSAKMATLDEVLFYMSFLPAEVTKIIAINKANTTEKSETFAEYFFRTKKHLLRDVQIYEIDSDGGIVIYKN